MAEAGDITMGALARLGVGAAVCAGVGLGLADFGASSASASPQWLALPAGVALASTLALAAVGVLVAVARICRSASPLLTRPVARRAVDAITAGALALPLLMTLPVLLTPRAGGGVLPLALVGGGSLLTIALALVASRAIGDRAAWAAGAVLAYALAQRATSSVRLFERIDSAATPFAVVSVAAALASVALAWAVARLLRALGGHPPRVPLAVAAAVAGIAVAAAVPWALPVQYAEPRRVALAGALVLLLLGAVPLAGALPWRATATGAAAAVLGVGAVTLLVRPLTPLQWTLTDRMALTRELLATTGLLSRSHEALLAELRAMPAYAEGRDARGRPTPHAAPRPPARGDLNVLLITVDALRWDHLGSSGRARLPATPNMDRIAARGARFQRAYAQGAWTCLSVPALMWSEPPRDLRFRQVLLDPELHSYLPGELPPGTTVRGMLLAPEVDWPAPTLAERLDAAGLATVAITNDGFNRLLHPRFGFTRGFRHIPYPPERILGDGRTNKVLDDARTGDLALAELRAISDRRFFAWIHLFEPHLPVTDHPGLPIHGYAGDVMASDREIGRMLDLLDELGLTDRTLIVVSADHGEALGEHMELGHGLSLLEGVVHIPLLMAGPGVPPGDHDETVGLVDVAPTILALLGEPIPPSMRGDDLTPLLRGESVPSRPRTLETWRINPKTGDADIHFAGAVDGDVKVVFDLRAGAVAAFDLRVDPDEEGVAIRPEALVRGRALAAWTLGWMEGEPPPLLPR